MKNHKNCPICRQEIISDASEPISCALCGMVIDHSNMILLVESGEEKYFCLHGCYEKYSSINETGDIKNEI